MGTYQYTYFAISLSQPIKDYGYMDKGKALYKGFWRRFNTDRNFPEMTGRKLVAYFNFDTRQNPELVIKVALSAVSTEGAVKNLQAEAAGKLSINWLPRQILHGIVSWMYSKPKELSISWPCFILHCIIP